jgi:iron complex outermembrane recepter protein
MKCVQPQAWPAFCRSARRDQMEKRRRVGLGGLSYRGVKGGLLSAQMLVCLMLLFAPLTAFPQQPSDDLTDRSIEDLMNIHVTSASKEDQKMSQVAAAIFVIGQEDIRRSGATNIPDLLRMVPGLDVAQINANTWAISARGFNSQFANKLLVLVDGRAVYTPLLGGVTWDTVDVPVGDIDRIEVIRGPGGTVWGNNAVNGVINIITKRAQDTQGSAVTAGGGTLGQGFGTAQYGGSTTGAAYRVFANYLNHDPFPAIGGGNGGDGWHLLHGGFRVDTDLSKPDTLTLQGDLYVGAEGASIVHSVLSPPENLNVFRHTGLSGGNVLGRWNRAFSARSDLTVQFYFDRYTRSGPESRELRNTVDFDFRHHVILSSRHDLTWGAGYRYSADQTVGTIDQAFVPADRAGQLWNFFVEDQITLKPDVLHLYVGTKLENNYFTGFVLEPSIRVAWSLSNRQTLWASISDANRAPSRHDLNLVAVLAALPGPAEVVLLGNPNLKSEGVVAYELGYRTEINNRISVDLATFVNSYRNLESQEPLPSFFEPDTSPPLLVLPKSFANKIYGATAGAEASVQWKVTNRWTLSPGYSFLRMDLHTDLDSQDTTTVADTQGSNPGHQAQLRSHLKLPHGIDWDSNAYFVGPLPAQFVHSYTRVDSLLTWNFSERAQLGIVGQNLLSDRHVEADDTYAVVNSSEVKRTAYVKFAWRF